MNKSWIIIMMIMVLPLCSGSCISSINCDNNTLVTEDTMCEFVFDVPAGEDQVYIDIEQGSRFYGGRHLDFVVDADDTNFNVFVTKENSPLYIVSPKIEYISLCK